MTKLSLHPPSGFRDFSPEETLLRQFLMESIGRTYRKYGFQPVSVSNLENLPILQGKGGGSDNEKLIFKVLRRGEDLQKALEQQSADALADMGLRFDLTLPLARYYAGRRHELPKPFKVYHMAPVWRADRPQRGRFREFYQCDVDILGSKEIGAEFECLSAILEVYQSVGLPDIHVVLNDRRFLTALGASLGCQPDKWQAVLVAVDKLDKIGPEGVKKEILAKNLLDESAVDRLGSMLWSGREASLSEWKELCADGVASLGMLLSLLGSSFPSLRITFEPSLVRGQDYYTGTIFEIRHASLAGSLGGGGRYDRLLELFGQETVPAFGGSIGFERLCLILEEKGTAARTVETTQIFIPLFSEALRSHVSLLASGLRAKSYRVDVFPDAAKLKHQFKYADDRRIPITLILGEDEVKNSTVKIKDMRARTELEVSISDIYSQLEKLCL